MSQPCSFDGLDEWLAWLETLSPHEIDLGLERVREVLARLNLAKAARVSIVAGTNGKGSSVAMLEALLASTGESVATYTSPHVHAFNERIRVNGQAVTDQEIVAAFERIETVRNGVALTYFEFGTLAALVIFDRLRPADVILEVGLGGRLDAVNAVVPNACLITNVTLDHCDWLGDDVESIAAEKAGIMRSNTPVVFGSTSMPDAITAAAASTGADLIAAGRDFGFTVAGEDEWCWTGRDRTIGGLKMPSLEGRHQLSNAAAVLALVESLGLTNILRTRTINEALAALELPGRLQRICVADRTFVLDVAHNADSAMVLSDYMGATYATNRVIAVIGVLAGKDLGAIIRALQPVVDRWIACPADAANAVTADHLARQIVHCTGKPCTIGNSVEEALAVARNGATSADSILVTGSFHTVGPALRWLDDFQCAR
ncbi:MAG: bifunctional folylpolyglutamate synthase/dihydrofolate synthase [Gammaproteobacteria bacterium]|nr:bifunctional folylpolyglutamate synthase/dihydrofolate synthase [Gammaproteobacteria bacterium]